MRAGRRILLAHRDIYAAGEFACGENAALILATITLQNGRHQGANPLGTCWAEAGSAPNSSSKTMTVARFIISAPTMSVVTMSAELSSALAWRRSQLVPGGRAFMRAYQSEAAASPPPSGGFSLGR